MLIKAVGNSESIELNSEGLLIYQTKSQLGRFGSKTIPYKSIDDIIIKGNSFMDNGTLVVKLKRGYGADVNVQFSKNYRLFCDIANKVNTHNSAAKVVKTAAAGAFINQVINNRPENQTMQYRCSSFIINEKTKAATPVSGMLTINFQSISFETKNYIRGNLITDITEVRVISKAGLDIIFEDYHMIISDVNNLSQLISIISNRYAQLTSTQLSLIHVDNFNLPNKQHPEANNNNDYIVSTPAYKKAWFTWLFLIIFPPFGLFSLWAFSDYKRKTKEILTVIFGVIILAALIQ